VSFSYFDPTRVTSPNRPDPIEIVPAAPPLPARPPTTAETLHRRPAPDHPEIGRVELAAGGARPVVSDQQRLDGSCDGHQACSPLPATAANDPERVRVAAANAAVREAVSAMDEAIKNRNGVGFFRAARQAVTERLAERRSVSVSRVTPTEIQARLNGNGEKICDLFKRGDEVAYSHEEVTASELVQWRANIAQQLAHL
jgi:hypothetical protein